MRIIIFLYFFWVLENQIWTRWRDILLMGKTPSRSLPEGVSLERDQ